MAGIIIARIERSGNIPFSGAQTLKNAGSGGIIRSADFPPMFHDVGPEEGELG